MGNCHCSTDINNKLEKSFRELFYENKNDNDFVGKIKLFNDNIKVISNLYELFDCLKIFEPNIFKKITPKHGDDEINGYMIIRFYHQNKINYIPVKTVYTGFFDTWYYDLSLHSNNPKNIKLKIRENPNGFKGQEIQIDHIDDHENKIFQNDTIKKMKYLTNFYKFFNLVMNMYYGLDKFDTKQNEIILFSNDFIDNDIDVKVKYPSIKILNNLVSIQTYLERKPIPKSVLQIIQNEINKFLSEFHFEKPTAPIQAIILTEQNHIVQAYKIEDN